MRALVDENIPRSLPGLLAPEVDASSVQRHGWSGTRNGDLLKLASESFDIFITIDRGIPHQQNLGRYEIGIILLEARSNRADDLAPLVPQLKKRLKDARPGTVIRVAG